MVSRIFLIVALFLLPEISEASSIVESSFGEFGDTFSSRSTMPAGVDSVTGAVILSVVVGVPPTVVDDDDYIAFTDLVPGSSFFISTDTLTLVIASFRVLDDSGGVIAPKVLSTDPASILEGFVPSSGEIVIEVDSEGGSGRYQLSIDAQHVPEPSTACLLAAGLVALARMRPCAKIDSIRFRNSILSGASSPERA